MDSKTRLSKRKRGFKRSKFILPALSILGLAGCFQSARPVLQPGDLAPAGNGIVEVRVATSSDDAEESATGSVSLSSTDLELIRDSSDQKVGMRFAGLTLPKGATVTNAYVQFKVDETSSEATSLTIQGEASDNALTFSSSNKVSTRAKTSASVAWSPVPWTTVGTVGPDQRTPNLASIIQEIVSRPGWASGHALTVIVTGSGKRVAKSYNGDAAGAPLLHVEYSTGGGGGGNAPPKVDSFTAAPNSVTTGQAVTFSWSVSDPEGGALSCTLDVDGNGTADYTFSNCKTTTSQTHSYAAAGSYQAKLTVNDSSNASASAQVAVTVSGGGGGSGGGSGAVTLESRVAASTDDAEEKDTGAMYKFDKALEFVFNTAQGANQTVGLRFDGLNLPRGVAITNAYIQFAAKATTSEATSLTFQGEASDDASTFNTAKNNITGRTKTAAAVAWSPATWTSGAAGPEQRTPDLTAIVQEIVNRPGWASGHALAFIVSGSGQRIAWAYDGDTAKAALLHVEYSTTSAPPKVNGFTVNPGSAQVGQAVTFNWSVSDPNGGALSCTLDADGDGTADYTFSNCKTTTSQTHSYAASGSYSPVLTVKNADDATDTAMVSVQITNGNAVTLATAGDIACDPTASLFNGGAGTPKYCHMKATSDLLLNLNPTAVLTLGDNQYQHATLDAFQQSYAPTWGRLKNITYPAPGSHEYATGSAAGYFDYFGSAAGDPTKGYYSFDLGAWHLIVLNSNCLHTGGCSAGSPEEQWLRADLAASAKLCTLAVIHYPLFSSGKQGNKTSVAPLWQALYEAGAELVLSGNDHHYERFAPQDASGNPNPNGVREIIVGTGGKELYVYGTDQPNSEIKNNDAFGVLQLTLKPGSYDWAFVPEPGKAFTDSGSQTCH